MLRLTLALLLFLVGWSVTGGAVLFVTLPFFDYNLIDTTVLSICSGLIPLSLYHISSIFVPSSFVAKKIFPNARPAPDACKLRYEMEALCRHLELDAPNLFIYPSPSVNAAAAETGGRYTVFVAEGLLEMPFEIQRFVLAHELGHIYHRDSAILAFQGDAIAVQNFGINILYFLHNTIRRLPFPFCLLSHILMLWHRVGMVVVKVGSALLLPVFRLLSRQQEYAADEFAGELVGKQGGVNLFSALSTDKWRFTLYSTHPSPKQRVENLLEQAE